MSCPACTAAQTDAHHPIYQATCRSCSIRALAGSIAAFESAHAGRITPAYKSALLLVDMDWQQVHADVKQERARVAALKDEQ